jgi:hypothetical protein
MSAHEQTGMVLTEVKVHANLRVKTQHWLGVVNAHNNATAK